MAFDYENKNHGKRIAYLLKVDHPFDDIKKRMEAIDKLQILSIDLVSLRLKLSSNNRGKDKNQLG